MEDPDESAFKTSEAKEVDTCLYTLDCRQLGQVGESPEKSSRNF